MLTAAPRRTRGSPSSARSSGRKPRARAVSKLHVLGRWRTSPRTRHRATARHPRGPAHRRGLRRPAPRHPPARRRSRGAAPARCAPPPRQPARSSTAVRTPLAASARRGPRRARHAGGARKGVRVYEFRSGRRRGRGSGAWRRLVRPGELMTMSEGHALGRRRGPERCRPGPPCLALAEPRALSTPRRAIVAGNTYLATTRRPRYRRARCLGPPVYDMRPLTGWGY